MTKRGLTTFILGLLLIAIFVVAFGDDIGKNTESETEVLFTESVELTEPTEKIKVCRQCSGSGRCTKCDLAFFPASKPGNCPRCDGTLGYMKTVTIYKNGYPNTVRTMERCDLCNYSGKCPACDGIGRCKACDGTGEG